MSGGKLTAIGVGPGDPELLTLKAARVLASTRLVFTAASPRNDYSQALNIAREHLPAEAEVVRLDFPMTRDRTILDAAWATAAETVADRLSGGGEGVFLTLGDPLTYSTFGYLRRTLAMLAPDVETASVPGVTSYHAAASGIGRVLVEGSENLVVLSGVDGEEKLRRDLAGADNAVILKAYRNLPVLRRVVRELGLEEEAMLVSRLGMPDGPEIRPLAEAPEEKPSYFTLLVIARKR
ncbi:precorrin-2 C(20)-methyltransferase [Desulfohalovibrio reitneri]|uniref:precorrin-2 C(20)-methyltransferase n=1 Tax=Desulfohalovibrio reitneri TaxID=1307759 RepID=UPI0004A6B7E4|nr:precorrin-2 C(20)-methyltransferase [Desulfohalovibrio reitneri]